jgi:hypothetical protein
LLCFYFFGIARKPVTSPCASFLVSQFSTQWSKSY